MRVSDVIGGPVTFGSTILLPPHYDDWDLRKRQAVLAHEGAHVANRDFYVLLLASLNRAVFWFSPFAWWQLTRLAELAEIISDASALEVVEDRLSYAEILLDLVQRVRQAPAGLADGAGLHGARTRRAHSRGRRDARAARLAQAGLDRGSHPAGWSSSPPAASPTAVRRLPPRGGRRSRCGRRMRAPELVSFYSLGRDFDLRHLRESDELFGQLSGQRKVRLAAVGDGTYAYPAPAGEITFAIERCATTIRADADAKRPDHPCRPHRRTGVAGYRGRCAAARLLCRLVRIDCRAACCR